MDTPWLRQGDVFKSITSLVRLSPELTAEMVEAPHGVAVASQTCDVVRGDVVLVAPVVRLEGPDAIEARKGHRPRFVHLAELQDSYFIDLQTICTIPKSLLAETDRISGSKELHDIRRVAQSIGRRFARFAFPDEVVAWLRPLQTVAKRRAGRPNSAEGAAMTRIEQIRIRSDNGWTVPPFELSITLIREREPFSLVDTEVDMHGRPAIDIAQRLKDAEPDEFNSLLRQLGEAWLSDCQRAGRDGVVASFEVDVATAEEFTLAMWASSEALDLEYLSDPGGP